MSGFLAAIGLSTPEGLKRALASFFGFVVLVFINPFLAAKGLPPISDSTVIAAAGVIATFVAQSGYNSAVQKKVDAGPAK